MNKVKLSIMLAAFSAGAICATAQDADDPAQPFPAPPPVPVAPGAPVTAAPAAVPELPLEPLTAQVTAAVNASRDQLTRSAKALAESHKQLAQAAAADAPFKYAWTLGAGPGSAVKRALVIPKDGAEAKGVSEIEEDMGVMAHILDKAISSDGKSSRPMGITVYGLSSSGGGQNLFIEGYGAIFFENVNFPLLPPASKEKEGDAKEKANSEWEAAKSELARPGREAGDFRLFEENFDTVHWAGKGVEYDADKVEDLKKDLITALKNAANIRKLKSDETVTVVVTGAKSNSGKVKTAYAPVAKTEPVAPKKVSPVGGSTDSGKLIIRARKSDTESFLNGKLNFDDFRKRATVLLY